MDLSDATKTLLDRIQKLEPELATKIIGCILIQDDGERDMIRLAYAPEKFLEELVHKTKLQLGYLSKSSVSSSLSQPISISPPPVSDIQPNYMPFSPNGSDISPSYMPFSPNGSRPYSSPTAYRPQQAPYWDIQPPAPERQSLRSPEYSSYNDFISEEYCLQNQAQFMGLDDQLDHMNGFPGDVYYPDAALGNLRGLQSPSLSDVPLKPCHYFSKGFCKHGNSCRYLHGPEHNFPPIFSPNELGADDHIFYPGSLEKLEVEILELLKSRRGNPVSIASLPSLFQDKYGRNLQADGYLTESQRHGRAGYSLTKLLARLKRIRLIDRPHGQHAVILSEDASKYNLDNRSERNDPGPIVNGSRQVYMTFPADSNFTEEDVSNYFGTFGVVEDVRIPCQQKRMFGFVTFASADTVKTVLTQGNPHYVCGSRVLVKPYREKSKQADRKFMEKNDHGMYYSGNYLELEPDSHSLPRCDAPRFLRIQMMEEQEQKAIELERIRHLDLQLGRKNIFNHQYGGYGMEELNAVEDHSRMSSAEQYQYMLDVFNNYSINDDRSMHLNTNYTDQESQGIDLPESPFASTIGNSVSAVI